MNILKIFIILTFTAALIAYTSSCENENDNGKIVYGSVKDIDGNTYKTVKIGTQLWMAENLKSTQFNDGTDISLATNNYGWDSLSTPAYTWYNNDSISCMNTYGALYNWYTIDTLNLCPTGWHIPDTSEWNTLEAFLGGDTLAAAKLKEYGAYHWASPNSGADNVCGFNALPGGYLIGHFSGQSTRADWWSSTEKDTRHSLGRVLYSGDFFPERSYLKTYGLSVRCIKD